MKNLVTSRTIAKHFGVTIGTINKWVRENRIPYVRASRRVVRFCIDDVEAALSREQFGATSFSTKGGRNV